MARPIKDGVDYFPKDTDFYSDDKVRLLRAEFGAKGMYILDYILCEIYRTNGYFLLWDQSKCLLVSDGAGCGCSPSFIDEFISGCLRCSFFDKRVFELFGVLTSSGIQRRYIRMFNSRDEITIIKEYWLLDSASKKDVPPSVLNKITFKTDKSTENPDKSTENPDKSTENPQSKVEGTKVPQSIIENTIAQSDEDSSNCTDSIVIILPLAAKDSFHMVTQQDVEHYAELYPAVDIVRELKYMKEWLDDNPMRRKTDRGIKSFITRWLKKTQDKGGVAYGASKGCVEQTKAVSGGKNTTIF